MNPAIISIITSADALEWIANNSYTLADLE